MEARDLRTLQLQPPIFWRDSVIPCLIIASAFQVIKSLEEACSVSKSYRGQVGMRSDRPTAQWPHGLVSHDRLCDLSTSCHHTTNLHLGLDLSRDHPMLHDRYLVYVNVIILFDVTLSSGSSCIIVFMMSHEVTDVPSASWSEKDVCIISEVLSGQFLGASRAIF